MFYSHVRVYVDTSLKVDTNIKLYQDHRHYLIIVLRLQVGAYFRVFNSVNGEFIAQIISISKHYLLCQIMQFVKELKLEPRLALGLCLIKPNKMLDAINMAVQLGVTEIIPLLSTRSQRFAINYERFTACIIEAVEQSGRLCVPTLKSLMPLNQYSFGEENNITIYANEHETVQNSMRKIKYIPEKCSLIIGPEGGFTKDEQEMLAKKPYTYSVSLGQHILRSETAVATGLAQLQLMLSSKHS